MSVLRIPTAEVFVPCLAPSRYKGAYGGRGSGKSHFFAGLGVERALMRRRSRGVCLREVQKDLKESAKQLIEDKIRGFGLQDSFDIQRDLIRTPGDGLIVFRGMQDMNADSIKSLEDFDWAWLEEGQMFSKRSIELLRPTIRAQDSEIWVSWNPRNPDDPVDKLLRGPSPPDGAVVVRANYTDNPWFPQVLEEERAYDETVNRERYGHVWLGDYEPAVKGAIWDRATIHQHRRRPEDVPPLIRVVVAVDPAISSEPGADEHGIVVCGLGDDGRGYVLDDMTTRGEPRKWAERAIAALDLHDADAVVIEVNQGGDMCRAVLKSVRPTVRVIEVRATRGKHVRAEPISALYHLGRVSHVGTFGALEDQMCQFTAAGYEGKGSPDRGDALVWGMTELFPRMTRRGEPKGGRPMSANAGQSPARVW